MAVDMELRPTPRPSPYVQQFLAQKPIEIGAFSKKAQIQEAILKVLGQGLGGYFEGRERRRSEGVRDRLRDVIAEIPTRGPSGWVNPDAGWVPPEGVVDVSMVRQGRLIPEAERGDPRYRMSTDLMGRQGRDEPYTPRDIVPFRPDDPKGTVLADRTQLRGKEALFSAIATDPQLQSLVGSDIDTLTQVMMADLLQKAPGQYLTPAEKETYGYGPTDVVWQTPGEPPQVVKSVTQKVPDFVEYWDNATGDSLGLVERGSPKEAQLVATGGITGEKPAQDLKVIRALKARGIVEGSPEYNRALDDYIKNAANNAPKVEVNNIQAGVDKEQQKLGELRAVRYDDIIRAASASEQLISQLELMGSIPIPEEGILTPFRDVLRKWSFAIGIPLEQETIDKIDNVAKFQAVMTDLLSAKLATQTGPQTDEDARRMMASLASLTNLKDANHFIIQMGIALESRKIEQSEFWVDWEAKHDTTRGAQKAWRAYKQETPLFTRHPDSSRHMFYSEWKNVMREANRGKENLEWDGNTYENTPKGFEALWQAQHKKYLSTVAGQ